MCNLYSLTKSQDEIRRLFEVETDRTGNLPPLPGIFPNTAAPTVHALEGQRPLSDKALSVVARGERRDGG